MGHVSAARGASPVVSGLPLNPNRVQHDQRGKGVKWNKRKHRPRETAPPLTGDRGSRETRSTPRPRHAKRANEEAGSSWTPSFDGFVETLISVSETEI